MNDEWSPTSTMLDEAARLALDLGAEASQGVALVNLPKDDKNDYQNPQPKAGINFVAYNQSFDVVPENTGVLLVEDKINKIQTLASDKIVIQEAGFIEIFANNEAQTPVYFDNLMVAQSSSRVLEVNAYYPYGMIIPALSTAAAGDEYNAYKFSAAELETTLNLGWYNLGNRYLAPVVGRFMVPDRFAEKYYHLSPYSYAANNPVNLIDINGDSIWIYYGDRQKMLYTAGMKYDGDTFVGSVVDALNQLSSKSFGGYMIGQLQNSEFGFNISQGAENKATANFDDPAMKYDGGVYYTGANIVWTGKNMISLGHELGHGWDAMNGYDISTDVWDKQMGLPEGEVRAVHMENILRAEQNMSLRYYYSPLNEPPALVNPMGKEVRFGYDYRKGSNIPWNYGNGTYGTCRTNIGVISPIPVKPLILPRR